MKNQISTWLDFLATALALFTLDDRTPLLHPRHIPCSNTAGDLVFELNTNFHTYLKMVTNQYLQSSDSRPDDGELDFLFKTIEARQDLGLPSHLWIVSITDVETTTVEERILFVRSKLFRAVHYLDNFFDESWHNDRYLDPDTASALELLI